MKNIFIITIIITLAITFSSCKTDKKESTSIETTNAVYQCPMDCENGKTYKEKGSCPVCKMDLKSVKNSKHNGHNH